MAIVVVNQAKWDELFPPGPSGEEKEKDYSPAAKRRRAAKVFRTCVKGEAFHYPCGSGRKTKRVKNQSVTTQNRL